LEPRIVEEPQIPESTTPSNLIEISVTEYENIETPTTAATTVEEELIVPENDDLATYEIKKVEAAQDLENFEENTTTEKLGTDLNEELVDELNEELPTYTIAKHENQPNVEKLGTKAETFGNRVTVVRKGRKRTRFENFGAKNVFENESSRPEIDSNENSRPEIDTNENSRPEIENNLKSRPEIIPRKTDDEIEPVQTFENRNLVRSRFEPPTKHLPTQAPTQNRSNKSIGESSSKKSSNK